MKNYPHLYTPVNNKKAPFSNQIKTHKKSTQILQNQTQYNKVPSIRTMNTVQNSINRRGIKNPRISSRSIEQMHFDRSSQDNYEVMQRKNINMLFQENRPGQYYPMPSFGQYPVRPNQSMHDQLSHQSNEQTELYQKSYQKIGQIKFQIHNKSIDHELNQVLELIKQEKLRANQTVKTLKKAADHYKKICQSVTKMYAQKQTNTQQLIPYMRQVQYANQQTQYQQNQDVSMENRETSPSFAKVEVPEVVQAEQSKSSKHISPAKSQKIDGKQIEIYTKLATMLQDMNINSKNILPEDIQLNFEVKDYKNLSEAEIIKIQKFFIKKLVQKIPK